VPFRHGFTYNGHPTGCAVALANLGIIEQEALVERAARLGARLYERLRLLEALPAVTQARGFGLAAGLELDVEDAGELADRVRESGVIVRATGTKLVMSPPLTISEDDIDVIADVLDRELERTPVLQR
jgi:adenosylmethionine-8-amino-7-oxononanoate aminotransferase